MADHDGQKLTTREMVSAHAYPVLGAISTAALVVIAIAIIPIAKQAHSFNSCVKEGERIFPGYPQRSKWSLGLRVSVCNGRDWDGRERNLRLPR